MPFEFMGRDWIKDLRGSVVLDGAGHWVQQERPVDVTEHVLHFLNDIDYG
jgi:pimeloyl-ACP methyl ester carboxylesterase